MNLSSNGSLNNERVKQIPMSDLILQEKARQVAEQLAYSSEAFKASNDGCLKKFCNHHANPPSIKDPGSSIML